MSHSYNKLLERLQTGYTTDAEKFYYVKVWAQDAMGNTLATFDCPHCDSPEGAKQSVDLPAIIEEFRLEGILDGRNPK